MNIPSCPGNCGLKDQALALKWIKDNIGSFEGDSDNITIFGESAGSSSVHYQMLSPVSKDLFDRAIVQCGSALASWGYMDNPEEQGFKLGKILNYLTDSAEELVDFLKTQTEDALLNALLELNSINKKEKPTACRGVAFVPSAEKIEEGAFIMDAPENLLKTASPKPVIQGVNKNEGVLIFFGLQAALVDDQLNNKFADIIKFNTNCPPAKLQQVAEKVKKFYFRDELITTNHTQQIVNLFSDLYHMGRYQAFDYVRNSEHPLFMYEFVFSSPAGFREPVYAPIKGAAHAEELDYLLHKRTPGNKGKTFAESELKVIKTMSKMWTNFAKTGNPTPTEEDVEVIWLPCCPDKPAYLEIDETPTMKTDEKIWNERYQFWESILQSF